jgi:DNA-binding NtrC family response regulator
MANANPIQFTKPHESELISKLQNVGALIGIITNNQEMLSIFQYVGSIANSTQPILITGETGVGKELVARLIHKLSLDRGELVTVNVAGLDDNVFSDSLFGHAKGAFTGAEKARRGLIEKAGEGILFLDEIGNLSRSSQVKLLRLLQEGEYMPLGQDELKHTNAHIITATNMDLWSLQKSGHFRKDLNFRLRTHHINIPPLRERKDDIPLLLNHFVERTAQELNKKKPTMPKELIPLLETYSFPGNIRELQAMVYDAISRHSSRILSLDTFNKHIAGERKNITTYDETDANALVKFSTELPTIKHATQLLVNEALKRAKGNNTLASKMLGISRQALSKRLKNRSSVE